MGRPVILGGYFTVYNGASPPFIPLGLSLLYFPLTILLSLAFRKSSSDGGLLFEKTERVQLSEETKY